MNQKSELLHFYDNYYKLIGDIERKDQFTEKFYSAFLSGNNEIYQKYISETKIFDEQWIKTVESYVPSLTKIINNPRSTIKVEEEIVAVERAKKITSQSVKHLAANTHMIKEVRADGSVMPKNILTSYTDIDYGTYENRFIMTLIDRLFIFVRSRYEIIEKNIESFEKRRLHLKSDFPFNDTLVEFEMNFTLIDETEDKELNEFNKKLLKRVEYLNKVVTSLRSSHFMEIMKEHRKIYPPIMKTNVILKNVDFRNAYLLWLFIDRYNTLAFTTEVEEKDLTFNEDYYKAIHRQVLTTYSSIVANQEMNKDTYLNLKSKRYRKKSIKIKRTHKDDIVLTPEDEVIEDQTLNEYYLNANKEIFKQSLDYHLEQVSTYETGVKRALRDTLNISNALYESFFELEEDDDIFRRLITDIDVNEELAEARRKLLISKMIREVKAVDFNNSLRQEKKFLEDIIAFDSLLLKEHKERLKLGLESILDTEKVEHDKKQAILEKEVLDAQLKENQYLSNEIDKYRVEVNKKLSDYQKELEKEFMTETRKFRTEQRVLYNKALSEYKKKHMPKRRVTNEALKKEKTLMDENFNEQRDTTIKDYKQRTSKSRKTVLDHNKAILNRDKKNYLEMVKENKENIKELDALKKEYEQTLKELRKTLKEEERNTVNEFKEQTLAERRKEMDSLREEFKITNRLTKHALRLEIKKIKDRLKRETDRQKKSLKKKIGDRKKVLLRQKDREVKRLEKELEGKLVENKENLKKLEEVKTDYDKSILELDNIYKEFNKLVDEVK